MAAIDGDEEGGAADDKTPEGEGNVSTLIKIDKPKPMTTTVTLNSTNYRVLGKRTRTKWERRWVFVPNVLDLNKGEIWVQKWVTVESAIESKEAIKKIIKEKIKLLD